jgi:hypothetical protein
VVEVVVLKATAATHQTADPPDRAQNIREQHGNALMSHKTTVVLF